MGIYSTCHIKREDAIEQIRESFFQLEGMSNEHLEYILNAIYEDKTYFNFHIVDEYSPSWHINWPQERDAFR